MDFSPQSAKLLNASSSLVTASIFKYILYNHSEGEEKDDITGIEKELTQIRKIALSVINRLADRPTCPQYDTMKKIWNMVDKAIEQPQTVNKTVE